MPLAGFIPDNRAGLHLPRHVAGLHGWPGLHAMAVTFGLWRRHARDRRALAALDGRSLRDVGLAPGQVDYELHQPFWRALDDRRF